MPITLGHHAVALDRNQFLCSCPELGCNQKTIQYRGKVYQGKIFSRQSYPGHLQRNPSAQPEAVGAATNVASAVVQLTPSTSAPPVIGQPTPSDSSAPAGVQPMASTSSGIYAPQLSYLPNLASAQASTSTAILPPIGGAVAATRPNKRAREELDKDRDSDDSDLGNTVPPAPKASRTQLTYTSNTPSLPKIFLQHPMCLREMFKVTKNHLFNNLGVDACRQSLQTARDSVEEHLKQLDPNIKTTPWTQIPRTIPTLLKTFDLNTTIQSKICCPFCCALHPVLPIDQINMNQLCNHP
ncbi:uncharacterized protein MELLADRAFT_96387 [Melampsora larici-populina 98AG31]|uniref:Uncharacterized protein n=1 Tax=Melampsora larici-populina (strain 98AG31 / pathotype 3-4-7) TaxID=747676 RepID=F4REL2_MELLP|nr:uncharacterized protein MELLADRAFT_96387 [Melampsora larici-populina 98AG31]EGG09258.1 hypothetical protein MELLADRAFT_96387 [Melampsora larici-populina 98AG31]